MRGSALAGLVLLCSACASGSASAPAPPPGVAPRVGVLVPVRRQCPRVVIGPVVRRVCLPGRGGQPADTTARDTTRTDAPATRAAAAGGR